MIGWFGWLDTPSPAFVWVLWTLLLGSLVFVAVLWTTRRQVTVLLGLIVAVIVVPVVIESETYADAGALTWQGRYTLPFAVGAPILAGFALSSSERGRQVATRRFVSCVGVLLLATHVVAFAQNLRRYTVGYYGHLQFWKNARWTPPIPPLLITIAFAVVAAAFLFWLLRVVPGEDADARAGSRARDEHSRSAEREEVTA
jgi:DMSO reductase anchor subunit